MSRLHRCSRFVAAGLSALIVSGGARGDAPAASLASGPLQVAAAEGDAGLVRRVEPRTGIALGVRGALLIDEPGFYGMAMSTLSLEGSWALSGGGEVFASLTATRLRFLQNATISNTAFSLGPATVGATLRAVSLGDGLPDVAPFLRLHLPTDTEPVGVLTMGAEPGVSLRGRIGGGLSWHAGAALPVLGLFAGGGGVHGRAFLSTVAGGSWSPWRWCALTAEASARFGPSDLLQQATGGAGLRFAAGRVGIEAGAVLPFAGTSRWNLAALVGVSVRLE